MKKPIFALLSVAATLSFAAPALADDPDPACAEIAARGDDDATKLALALCHAKVEKTATAWGELVALSQDARAAGEEEIAAAAKQHADALAPRLVHLRVEVSEEAAKTRGLAIRVGDRDIDAAHFGAPIPIDPGAYWLVASAPGKRSKFVRVLASEEDPDLRATVGALEDAPRALPTKPFVARDRPWSPEHRVAVAATLLGVATAGVGLGFAIAADESWGTFHNYGIPGGLDACKTMACPAGARAAGERAKNESRAAVGFAIAGGALAAGGAILFLAAPEPGKARIGVGVSPGYAGLVGRASF